MRNSKKASLILGITLALTAPQAWADTTTVAEALFDSGRQLFEEGKYDEACEKFAESQRLDPGTGTLLNLAVCYEKAGRLATAWSTYRLAASSAASAGQDDRAEHARQEATNLESRLARVTIEISPEAKVDGLIILQDGTEQSTAVAGVALPVDAGLHKWEVSAPGYQGWQSQMEISDGEQKTVKIPALIPEGEALASEQAAPSPSGGTKQGAEVTPEDTSTVSQSMKLWGYVLSGVGVAGIGVGSVFGVTALKKNKDSEFECVENRCTRDGVDLRDQALAAGTLSTVFIGVGVAALGAGVTLLVLAPRQKTSVSAAPLPGGGRLLLEGTF